MITHTFINGTATKIGPIIVIYITHSINPYETKTIGDDVNT